MKFFNRRLSTVFLLGFSSGLPLALTGSTLQAWFTQSGVDIVTIGMLALIGQPYLYKFIWAPLLDRFIPPLLGRRRGWIFLMQFILIGALIAIAMTNPQQHLVLMTVLALSIAFLSATQDVAIDAYRTELLPEQERGLGAAMAVGGYRLAMLVSGALALVLADQIGWQTTYLLMAILMALTIIVTCFGPELVDTSPPQTLKQAVIEPWREFISRNQAVLIVLFILLYKFGEAFTSTSGPVTNTFLLRGLEFSLTTVGTVNKGVGLLATLLGVFWGGMILSKIGTLRALMQFGLLQALSNLTFLILAMAGKSYALLVSAVFIDNLCGGMGTAALVAFIMSQCDKRYTATQFALFSSLAAVTRIIAGPIAGIIVQHGNWITLYIWAFILAWPGLLVLYVLNRKSQLLLIKP